MLYFIAVVIRVAKNLLLSAFFLKSQKQSRAPSAEHRGAIRKATSHHCLLCLLRTAFYWKIPL
jgi:hypothetical protein